MNTAKVLLIVAAAIVGFGLRSFNVDWGLPTYWVPDEYGAIKRSESVWQSTLDRYSCSAEVEAGDQPTLEQNWNRFVYPHLHYYTLIAVGRLSGQQDPARVEPHPESRRRARDVENAKRRRAVLAGRWVSVVLSTATILTTAAIAFALYGPRSAVVAAALLAVTPYHVVYAHIVNVDTAAVFWGTVSMTFAALAMTRRSIWLSIGAGFFSGLSAAAKYPGILALTPLLVSVPYLQWTTLAAAERRTTQLVSSAGSIAVRWVGAAAAAVVAFALGCPLCASDPITWWRNVQLSQAMHAGFFNLGYLPPESALLEIRGVRDIAATIPMVSGWGIYLLAIVALLVAIRRRDLRALIPMVAIAPLVELYADVVNVFPRYFLLAGPALAVLAASLVPQVDTPLGKRRIGYLLIATAIAYSLALSGSMVDNLRVDDREATLDWIEHRSAQRPEPVELRPTDQKVTVGVSQSWTRFEALGGFQARSGLRIVPLELKEKLVSLDPPSYLVLSGPVYQRTIRRTRRTGEFVRKIDRGEAGYRLAKVIESRFLTDALYTWLTPQYQSSFARGRVGFRIYERIDPPT